MKNVRSRLGGLAVIKSTLALSVALVIFGACAHARGGGESDVALGSDRGQPKLVASPDQVQVMVVGTYHFSNPGQDLHNVESEDVLTEARQHELEVLAEVLAAFEPTKVAIEATTDAPGFMDPDYSSYGPTILEREPSESVQIGYRLAAKMGHPAVYGIDEKSADDEPDYFPFGAVMALVEKEGRGAEIGKINEGVGALIAAFGESQAERSIPDLLLDCNGGPLSGADFYYDLLDFDAGEAQPAAELNAYWFMRNAKIFAKLLDVVETGDRVVVVFGAGHKHWLEHLIEATPKTVLVDPVPYLRLAKKRLASRSGS